MAIEFRGFEVEIGDLAGTHDGLNQVLSSRHFEDRAVYLHEQAHAKVFKYSFDGFLHVNVLRLIELETDGATRKQLMDIAYRLFDETATAHEQTATFLGVVSLSTRDEMADALGRLPLRYLEYHSFFNNLVGSLPSTFVQYAAAWAIACAAFSSPRLALLGDMPSLVAGSFFQIPGPGARLRQIAADICAMGVPEFHAFAHSLLDRIFEENGFAVFDYTSDEQWKERAETTEVQAIEKCFIEQMEEFAFSLFGSQRVTHFKIPECFARVAPFNNLRKFDHVFPFVDNKPQLSEEAAQFYAREADANRISRPGPHHIMMIQDQEALIKFYTGLLDTPCDRIRLAVVARPDPTPHYVVYFIHETGLSQAYAAPNPLVCMVDQFNTLLKIAHFVATEHSNESPELSVSLAYEVDINPPKRQSVGWALENLAHPIPSILKGPPVGADGRSEFSVYIFIRSTWSGILRGIDGRLDQYNALLRNEDLNEDYNMYISVLYPDAEGHVPYISIMSNWDFTQYRPLMDRRADDGSLIVTAASGMSPELSSVVVSLWETLNLV